MELAAERLLHRRHFAGDIVAMATAMFVGFAVDRAAAGPNLVLCSGSVNGTVAVNETRIEKKKYC